MDDKQTVPNQTTESEQPIEPSTQATVIVGEMDTASAPPNTPIEQQPAPVNQVIQPPLAEVKKPSKWRYVFITSTALQALGIILFTIVTIGLIQWADEGMAGTEYFYLAMLVTVVPALALLALINVIGLPIYLKKQKPRGKGLAFWITSLAVSLCLVLYGLYVFGSFFLSSTEADRLDNAAMEQIDQEFTDADGAPLSTE